MNKHPIFILGAHKSGTSMLRSILDGHPDLFVIPFETHYFQNMHYWVDYNYRMERPQKISKKQLIDRFAKRLYYINKATDIIGDLPLEFNIDVKLFCSAFAEASPEMEDRPLFELYIQALYQTLYKKTLPPELRLVEKSVEHAEFACLLKKMFPGARFVHILRNPYANAVSLRKYKTAQSRFPLIFRLCKTLYNSYYYLYKNPRLIENYYIVKYEDILNDPPTEIKRLASFLDIEFTDDLLTPTKLGNFWRGNSSEQKPLNSFDKSRIEAWKSDITPMEIRFINSLFPFIFDDFGYQQLSTPSLLSFLKPVSGEGMLRYLLNRGYLGYISYNPGSEI